MRKKVLFLFCFLFTGLIFGQNLVENGSFEDYIICPKSKNERFPLKEWERLHNNNSTDYFNTSYLGCFDKSFYFPGQYKNTPYTKANTGASFIGMYPICLNLKSKRIFIISIEIFFFKTLNLFNKSKIMKCSNIIFLNNIFSLLVEDIA